MNSCRRTREESTPNYQQRAFSLVIIAMLSSPMAKVTFFLGEHRYENYKLDQQQTMLHVFNELLNIEISPVHNALVLVALFVSQQILHLCYYLSMKWNRKDRLKRQK